jgi:hypothetical protein
VYFPKQVHPCFCCGENQKRVKITHPCHAQVNTVSFLLFFPRAGRCPSSSYHQSDMIASIDHDPPLRLPTQSACCLSHPPRKLFWSSIPDLRRACSHLLLSAVCCATATAGGPPIRSAAQVRHGWTSPGKVRMKRGDSREKGRPALPAPVVLRGWSHMYSVIRRAYCEL